MLGFTQNEQQKKNLIQNMFSSISEYRFFCDVCPKAYKHQASLYNHKSYECQKKARFECPECEKKFTRAGSLSMHRKNKH